MTRGRRPAPRDASSPPSAPARTTALRLLGRRDYSVTELRDRLARRGYPADDIETTVERLQADGLLDDRRFAEAYVRTASRLKSRGRRRIERELVARGIDRSLAADLTAGITDDVETTAIERLLLRRRLSLPLAPAARRSLYQQLLRRGFSSDAISAALAGRGIDVDPDD
ncbi:MAG: regulatory protein RecX [Vicinamibacterales bacterium]